MSPSAVVARRPDHVRLQVEAEALGDVLDARHAARVGHARQALVAQPSRPQALFVLALHRTLEVGAPDGGPRVEVQCLEGHFDFRGPSAARAPYPRNPDAVPRLVHAAAKAAATPSSASAKAAPTPAGGSGDQAVAHGARRVDLEEVTGAPVHERVDREQEAVVRRERRVALHLVAKQLVGLRVEAGDAQDDSVLVEDHPDFCSLGGRRAVVGIALPKVGGRDRLHPGRIVGRTVNDEQFTISETVGLHFRPRILRERLETHHTETQKH